MPLKNESAEEPSINLTPMVDVVMLLIIFFLVGTQFNKPERQYEINLPTVSDAQPLTSLPDEIIVNVSKTGEFEVNGQTITVDELESTFRDAQQRYEDQVVIIRGDGEGAYQNVMTVLNLCHRTRIVNVQLANRLESQESG
ncbi:MAG: biopolymer transporter ExbD [Planctomycetaceae bacterium]|nr:biopolymer transporter ExbD [Planctomycetaceae bacterium]